MFIKGTLTITGDAEPPAERTAAQIQIIRDYDKRNKVVLLKNCTPFTAWISGINNTQIDNAKDIDVVKSMYNLIDNSNNYLKTSRSLDSITVINQMLTEQILNHWNLKQK